MTVEEYQEASKDLMNIFEFKSKSGRPLTGNKTLTTAELSAEIGRTKSQAKRLGGTSNISWYMNKTVRDPVQEQISRLGYFKPKSTRTKSINNTTDRSD